MLGVFATVLLGFVPSYAVAQTATCLTGFTWSFNAEGDSPCDIAAALAGVCIGGTFTLQPLQSGFVYLGPTLTNANECRCSSVYYSLLSACAVCQGRDIISWSSYKTNCTTAYLQVYPKTIPTGFGIPHYAYLDVSAGDAFNQTLAQEAGGTESTSIPSATVSSTASSSAHASQTNSTSSGKKSNAGAIAGGVVGGIVVIGLAAGLVFWLLKRRGNAPPASGQYEHTLPSQTQMSYAPSSLNTGTQQRIYDPSDPSTFPSSESSPGFSGGFTPSPDSHPPFVTPNYTGNTVQTTAMPASRPQYTGAPEL